MNIILRKVRGISGLTPLFRPVGSPSPRPTLHAGVLAGRMLGDARPRALRRDGAVLLSSGPRARVA
jgi:hypothetical protein